MISKLHELFNTFTLIVRYVHITQMTKREHRILQNFTHKIFSYYYAYRNHIKENIAYNICNWEKFYTLPRQRYCNKYAVAYYATTTTTMISG